MKDEGGTLLARVREAAEEARQSEDARRQHRERLLEAMRAADAEGVSRARIARAAGLSRQRVTELLD